MAGVETAPRWLSLPDLADALVGSLSHNDCVMLRMVTKELSQHESLSGFTVFRLSECVPNSIYSERWDVESTAACLSLERRRQLVKLTAASGSLENLQVAVRRVQCSLSGAPLAAAAAAGHIHICQWLRRHSGCLETTDE